MEDQEKLDAESELLSQPLSDDSEYKSTQSPIAVDTHTMSSALMLALEPYQYGTDFILNRNSIPRLQKELDKLIGRTASKPRLSLRMGQKKYMDLELMSSLVLDSVQAVASDSFWECFERPYSRPWNWTFPLWVTWATGCIIRYCILLPIRAFLFLFMLVFCLFGTLITSVLVPSKRLQTHIQRRILKIGYHLTLLSIGAVVLVHGSIPHTQSGRIYVANHTTIMDAIILSSIKQFAIVGQKYSGLLGIIEERILGCLDPVWFNRSDRTERTEAATKIKNRIYDEGAKAPLLLFPEGVLVNNRFIIMFKKGAFELGAEICPIAIKYNETLSSHAYWSSRDVSFYRYLFDLMTNWILIVDVWFLPPTSIQDGETPEEFAERVKLSIARAARLIPRPWDGYLKYTKATKSMHRNRKTELLHQIGFSPKEIDEMVSG